MFTRVCGVRPDSTLICWNDTPPAGSFTSVAVGGGHTCAVRSDGTVVCWGQNNFGQATPPSGSFLQVIAGSEFSCGLRSDQTVVCWGNPAVAGTEPSGTFAQISANGTSLELACGVRTDGVVNCWGNWIRAVGPAVYAPVCGNGALEAGEQCDDGNTQNGDCCSRDCTWEPLGTACEGDANVCTVEQCNGAETCGGVGNAPSGTPCDLDSNACTTDQCDGAGNCVFSGNSGSGSPCDDGNPCTLEACNGSGGCASLGPAPSGTACDDGVFCNGADSCDGAGACTVHSGDPCASGPDCNRTCNETNRVCFDPPGTPCSPDDLVCTVADQCDGLGSCQHLPGDARLCPKGYGILKAPYAGTTKARLAATANVSGSVCAEVVSLGATATVSHPVARAHVVATKRIRLGQGATVQGECVTGAGGRIRVGSGAACSDGTDNTGTSSLLGECTQAANGADQRITSLVALAPDVNLGRVRLSANQTLDVTPYGPLAVIDYDALILDKNVVLTIDGPPNLEAVIIRVADKLVLRKFAQINITPAGFVSRENRVIFVVGGAVKLGEGAAVRGTIVATTKGIAVGKNASVSGTLVGKGKGIRLAKGASVANDPWLLW